MSHEDLYLSAKATVQKFCVDVGKNLEPVVDGFDFDSTSEEELLPQADLIGPMEFYISSSSGMMMCGFKITAVTFDDPDIIRLSAATNMAVNAVRARGLKFPIIHYKTGAQLGTFTMDEDFYVNPVVRLPSKSRAMQSVAVVLRADLVF